MSDVSPPPAPASVPQENCPVAAFHRSLSAPAEHEASPAPVMEFARYRFVVVALVVVAFPAVSARTVVELVKRLPLMNVLNVYVFGMVVEALMYELTPLEKSETCEFVMERLLSVVIEFTDEVAARLPMNEVVARAVVK